MKEILYATDYSEASQAALPFATLLARQLDATLLIAHVSELERYPVGELFNEDPPPDEAELSQLRSVVPLDPAVRFKHRLLYGARGSSATTKPAEVILKLAKQEHPEAIVIGTHGNSMVADLLMGSVAETLLREASCPVVTIKKPKTQLAGA